MIEIKPKCCSCDKDIKGNDLVFVKTRYTKGRGFQEIKACLQNEGKLFCEDCFEK